MGPDTGMKSWLVQCSPDNFEHVAWLSAVFSEVLFVNEQGHSLLIFPLNDHLKGQIERLGAAVTRIQPCQS
jgi:hypothetical protein